MTLKEIAETLELANSTPLFDKAVSGVYISDMVSDVIANAKAGNILVTVQIHCQYDRGGQSRRSERRDRDPGQEAHRRRCGHGHKGRDPHLHHRDEPVAGGDAPLRSRYP